MSESPASRILALVERSPGAVDPLAAAWQVTGGELLARLRADAPVDADELFDAADVLDVPSAFLAGVPGASRGFAVALRVGALARIDAPNAALATVGQLLEFLRLLDLWQGRSPNPLADMEVVASGYFKNDGERTAERVRHLLDLNDRPVEDLVKLVERLGYPVAHVALPKNLCGINARDDHDGLVDRVILVNDADLWTRQRFTVAHELGHSVFDDPGQVIVDELEESDRLEELRANTFARHFLLPVAALRARYEQARAMGVAAEALVAQVMVEFGVSREVVVTALSDDALVPADHPALTYLAVAPLGQLLARAGVTDLWQQLAQQAARAGFSPVLSLRARDAYARGWIHPRIIAEIEGRTVDELLEELGAQ